MPEPEKAYQAGDVVKTITGEIGIVLGIDEYDRAKETLQEGKRPGHFFAPGCCANPDYIVQAPVLFPDKTIDVMRSLSIKKIELSLKNKERLEHMKATILQPKSGCKPI